MKSFKFAVDDVSKTFPTFRRDIFRALKEKNTNRFATPATWIKAILLGLMISINYAALLLMHLHPGQQLFVGVAFGISLLVFTLSISHDAAHGAFSKHKLINDALLYIPFSILGVDPKMWKTRHLQSHHRFPNVDGCDADIDENPFLRLSPNQLQRPWHRYQHWYALAIYTLAAPHAVWIQDLNYMRRATLANMNDWSKRVPSWPRFILLKTIHFLFFYGLPLLVMPNSATQIWIGAFIIQGIVSLFFILPLIGTHFSDLALFPEVKDGKIGFSYPHFQLLTSIDWNPDCWVTCQLMGGLNAHAAHHLFPEISSSHYWWITDRVSEFAVKNRVKHTQVGIAEAIVAHFRFLKKMSH